MANCIETTDTGGGGLGVNDVWFMLLRFGRTEQFDDGQLRRRDSFFEGSEQDFGGLVKREGFGELERSGSRRVFFLFDWSCGGLRLDQRTGKCRRLEVHGKRSLRQWATREKLWKHLSGAC